MSCLYNQFGFSGLQETVCMYFLLNAVITSFLSCGIEEYLQINIFGSVYFHSIFKEHSDISSLVSV